MSNKEALDILRDVEHDIHSIKNIARIIMHISASAHQVDRDDLDPIVSMLFDLGKRLEDAFGAAWDKGCKQS